MFDLEQQQNMDIDDDNYDDMPALCDSEKPSNDNTEKITEVASDKSKAVMDQDISRNVDADGWEDVLGSGRLKKKIITEGNLDGGKPARGSSCNINYVERLESGQEVGRGEGVVFIVGESELIQAFDLVVPLMYPGEVSEVKLEHTFGYGVSGDASRVPGNSHLQLEITLIDWQDLGPVPDIPRDQRMKIGMRKRERGNKHFSRGEYSSAIQCYRWVGTF